MDFFTVEKISPNQSVTPEGYLLCLGTPIARTGMMTYAPDQTPVGDSGQGYVKIWRKPEQVFAPKTIASGQGKSLVDDHPPDGEFVTPVTWKELTVGVVMNIRRGAGLQEDLMLADILVTDAKAIQLVKDGKRELSCGYDAEYFEIGPGEGEQRDIIINHVALVESGRCGPRCAIGDHASTGDKRMSKETIYARIRRIFRDDAEGMAKALEAVKGTEAEGGMPANGSEGSEDEGHHVHVHLHPKAEDSEESEGGSEGGGEGDRFKALETQHEEILARLEMLEDELGGGGEGASDSRNKDDLTKMMDARRKGGDAWKSYKDARRAMRDKRNKDGDEPDEGDGDLGEEKPAGATGDRGRARDSSSFEPTFQDLLSAAEVIVPGIHAPVFDRAAPAKTTLESFCAFRRRTLDLGMHRDEIRASVEEQLAGRPLSKMTCGEVKAAFDAVSAAARALNRSRGVGGGYQAAGTRGATGPAKLKSVAELNKHHAEFYGNKN